MGRSASPVTPGSNPTPEVAATADVDQLAQDTLAAGALAAAATSEAEGQKDANAVLHAELAKRDSQIAELMGMVKNLARNQVATSMPDKVELPSMKDAMKSNPKVPVLTAEGWFVPPIHPTDREKA